MPAKPILTINRKPKGTFGTLPTAPKPQTGVTVSPEPKKPDRRAPAKPTAKAKPAAKPKPKRSGKKEPGIINTNQKPARIRYKERVRELLLTSWPSLFNYENPRPLKVGIGEDLKADAAKRHIELPPGEFRFGMLDYTRRTTYHLAVIQGGPRYGLDGPAGEVTEEEIFNAVQRILEQGKEKAILTVLGKEAGESLIERYKNKDREPEPAPEAPAEQEETVLMQCIREYVYMTGDAVDSSTFGSLFAEWNELDLAAQLDLLRTLSKSPGIVWGAYGFGPEEYWFKAKAL